MKKWILILSILFLTGCDALQEPVEETDNDIIEPLPFDRSEYETLYTDSVLTVYGNKVLLSISSSMPDVELYDSSCVMEGYYYEAIRIYLSGEFLTVNEFLENSFHFDIDQLVRYGLWIRCTNDYTEGFIKSGNNTNVAYLQNINEIGVIEGYRLFEQLDNVGCCVISYEPFPTSYEWDYQVESSTLDREYFILVVDIYYSLEEALELDIISHNDVVNYKELLPNINLTMGSGFIILDPNEQYCFYSTSEYEYCVEDYDTYSEILVMFHNDEISLYKAIEYKLYQVLGIPEITAYERTFDYVKNGTYVSKYYDSNGEIQEVERNYSIIEYDENNLDTYTTRSVYGADGIYCMMNDREFNKYGLITYGMTINVDKSVTLGTTPIYRDITSVLYYLTVEETEILLGLNCEQETYTVDGREFNVSYDDGHIKALWDTNYGNIALPAFTSYTDEGISYCTQSNIMNETNFIYVDGTLYGIQEALDNDIIEGRELYRYALPKCINSWDFYSYPYDSCDLEIENCEERISETHQTIGMYNINESSHVSLYSDIEYYLFEYNDKLYITYGYIMHGYYTIIDNEQSYSLNLALLNELITFEDVLSDPLYNFVEYNYE